jgi:hypothetical protein
MSVWMSGGSPDRDRRETAVLCTDDQVSITPAANDHAMFRISR